MIDLSAAKELLNMGARIRDDKRGDEQLRGAVAIHNLLETHGVAVLADEVGMGKTYVALGALALFRHFNPDFRVLVLAPRENIQEKWTKELRNFVASNVRFPDLRVRGLDNRPAKPIVSCETLLELVHEASIDPHRDFFCRLTSFSLPLAGRDAVDPGAARKIRDRLRELLPWLDEDVFDLRDRQGFKDNVARAVCCALPTFDLVICDESHNLKHGFSASVSARNRVMAMAFGHPSGRGDSGRFPTYEARAKRVLFLSATPLEESFTHLWNQLDVFGLGRRFVQLRQPEVSEEEKKEIAGKFLVRRVTSMHVNGRTLTKNLYRREWRRGGVIRHDEPIRIEDPRSRLVVALVQKKVSEVLGHERFNASFQIGMLASFESFLETAKVSTAEEDSGVFDGTEQTEDDLEKEGVDVGSLNRLAKSYRERFGRDMPHPKMDALVQALKDTWRTGEKALVFVRRVASVRELKRKLDEEYDEWILARLKAELPPLAVKTLRRLEDDYRALRATSRQPAAREEGTDTGGNDTFFAWFFRGEGPRGIASGANLQKRFIDRGGPYATFFEDNYVADILGARPGSVEAALVKALKLEPAKLRRQLCARARRYLTQAKKIDRGEKFEAFQAAALELLKDAPGPWHQPATVVWRELFAGAAKSPSAQEEPELDDFLEVPTFFTELRAHTSLRQALWPDVRGDDERSTFRERELRARLLSVAARLGHAFVDLYVLLVRRLGSIDAGAHESDRGDASGAIREYLELLDKQRENPARDWCAYDELSAIAENYDLILDTNEPEARNAPLSEAGRLFGQLLRQQQPTGGMSGQVNRTLVRQFRMPGYPFVLVSTDLLQEGEDLHTFCSSVHHYGISWTPSAMEQRIGRIDRVRSQTDRELSALLRDADGGELLQVFFPHLEDTVEVLQVRRVLERMNTFLRLMHEGLKPTVAEDRRIDTKKEFLRELRPIEQIREPLRSAFPVREESLRGEVRALAATPEQAEELHQRFNRLRSELEGIRVEWEESSPAGMLLGTAFLAKRRQPFTLVLQSKASWPVVRCVSPVGRVDPASAEDRIVKTAAHYKAKVSAILTDDERTYDLSVDGETVLAADPSFDRVRVAELVRRVVQAADALEQSHLPGRDEALETFRADMTREVERGS